MSRPSSMMYTAPGATKQLSLTEELEKLEQSITLTLQEIDHNFNRCHRIVTHSILPIIDRFSEESSKVQEGSVFWKSFFERSANVSVGVYESHAEDEETTEITATTEEETFRQSHYDEDSSPTTYNKTRGSVQQEVEHTTTSLDLEDESILHSMNLNADHQAQSTPRPQKPRSKYVQADPEPRWADMKSPYEKEFQMDHSSVYHKQQQNENADDNEENSTFSLPSVARKKYDTTDESSHQEPPTTPESIRRRPGHHPQGHSRMLADTPDSSPYNPQPQLQTQISPSTTRRGKHDILLHRAVDTNWRIQATPLNVGGRSKPTTPKTALQNAQQQETGNDDYNYDSSPFSPAPPQMTTVFSPISNFKSKIVDNNNNNNNNTHKPQIPKTPASTRQRQQRQGQTPAGKPIASTTKITAAAVASSMKKYDYDDDDDDIDFEGLGFSPPVTMQFSLPPSKLLQTPAREASKKMVRDILQSAGVRDDTSSTLLESPSMLRAEDLSDDF